MVPFETEPSARPSSVDTRGEPSRLRPGMMDDTEPCRRVDIEMRLASLWKFCEEIRFRFGSDSGSGVPLRGGVAVSSKVTPAVGGEAGKAKASAAGKATAGGEAGALSSWASG